MFYWFYSLWANASPDVMEALSPLRIFKYITVRAFCGAGTAFLLSVALGPWMIRQLKALRLRQFIRKDEAPSLGKMHEHKEGTPTMGGLLIVSSIVISAILWAVPGNRYVLLALATLCYMAAVGFWDDYRKIANRRSLGLTARRKFFLQVLWCVLLTVVLLSNDDTRGNTLKLMVPFIKEPLAAPMPVLAAFLFLALVMVGASNAVNLTDGLDGLAIGCSSSVAFSYLIMAYAAGHRIFAEKYLFIPYVPGCGELAVFCGCMLGACLGFLWYNCHPAQVFMGDTGSLALGGAIAAVAILIKQELLLVIVGGVFVIEAMSVIIQVTSFKLFKKRVFLMSPIHHHFEMKHWSETQVTIRFWIVSIIFALLGILTLKVR